MNRGWTCPNCGGCYSPATPQCFNCTGRTSTASDTVADAAPYLTKRLETITFGTNTFVLKPDGQILPMGDK